MSRTESYRRVSREDLVAHGNAVIAQLKAEEAYLEVAEQAEALGVSISVYMRDTFTYDRRYEFKLSDDPEDIPYGYAADLRIDIVRDGHILFVCDEAGEYDQLSVSYPIITTPETFFGKKLKFIDYADIEDGENIIDYIGTFLDSIKEGKGGVVSVLSENDGHFEMPAVTSVITGLEHLPEGDVIEWLPGEFNGIYLGEKSAFFLPEAFGPFRLLLEARQFGFHIAHGVSQINREKWAEFSQDVKEFCRLLRRNECGFSDILSQMKLYSLEPSDREEKQMNALTFFRKDEFVKTCDALLLWGDEALSGNEIISVLWV